MERTRGRALCGPLIANSFCTPFSTFMHYTPIFTNLCIKVLKLESVSAFVAQCLAYEQYAFSWQELKAKVPKSDLALRHDLLRLAQKNELLLLRKGFYLILTPRYRALGKLPLALYVEHLFQHLNKPYYVAFYSAAALHGASHQQVQQSYLMTQVPNLRHIQKDSIYLNIVATSTWPRHNIEQRSADAGLFNISSPALTAIDLIHHQTKMGGLNRVITVLEELIEAITPTDLQNLLQWYPHTSSIQRMGLLFQELQASESLKAPLYAFLRNKKHFPVLLSPDRGSKPGKANNPWKVDVNTQLESDL